MTARFRPSDCPACGSAAATTVANRAEIRDELELLWSFHLRRLRTGVPVDRLADRVVFSQEPPLRVARCAACATVYRDPRDTERSVDERYRDEVLEPVSLDRLMATQLDAERSRVRRLERFDSGRGRGLEVGCYTGAFLTAAAEVGWSFEGIDVNEAAVAHARRRGLTARRARLTELEPDRRWDVVAIWTCLDQMPEPHVAVREATVRLRPGGLLAVRVPNGAFYHTLRRRLDGPLARPARALLGWNNLLGFPYLQAFSPDGLRGLFKAAGLVPLAVVGDALVPLSDTWTRTAAALEERAVKRVLRSLPAVASPWIEGFARVP